MLWRIKDTDTFTAAHHAICRVELLWGNPKGSLAGWAARDYFRALISELGLSDMEIPKDLCLSLAG